MSETRTVVTSENLMQHITGAQPATEAKTETAVESKEAEAAAATGESSQQPKKVSIVKELVETRHERNALRGEVSAARGETDAANARVAQLESELAEIRAGMSAAAAQPAPKELDPKPQRAQFVSDEDYQEALTDWKVDQKLAEQQQAEQQARADAAQQQLSDNYAKRLAIAKAEIPDFDEVVGKSEINLPDHLYVAIVESDIGPRLAYYLSQNPDEAALLKGMTPTAALRTLGKLEDRLAAEKKPAAANTEPAAKKKEPEVSKAPAPIEPLKDASTPVEKPTSQMTYQEYKAHRQAQQASKRR
ncbi:hypothetical protein [Burkholderia sp. Ax-1719]|uniref:hypothetical protein n=1 Tax=Burkholderia sp. Ax-1719 TaxID=2608334 RepID=UPI0014223E40|nr:hypothetical protein [Burkholderia sp. Ax-1719]NIE67469.1 hypothetical protein [Burkholderia sp. Ax-1719]